MPAKLSYFKNLTILEVSQLFILWIFFNNDVKKVKVFMKEFKDLRLSELILWTT